MAHSRRRLGFNETRYPKLEPPETHFVSPRAQDRRRGPRIPEKIRIGAAVMVINPDSMYRSERGTVVPLDARRSVKLDNFNQQRVRDGAILVERSDGSLFVVDSRDLAFYTPNTARERHHVADFNTLDDLLAHARGEGATHYLQIDDETHIYFQRHDGQHEKAEAWQKDGYWHTQAPGSRAVVRKPPSGAKPIGGRSRTVESPRRSAHHHPGRRK